LNIIAFPFYVFSPLTLTVTGEKDEKERERERERGVKLSVNRLNVVLAGWLASWLLVGWLEEGTGTVWGKNTFRTMQTPLHLFFFSFVPISRKLFTKLYHKMIVDVWMVPRSSQSLTELN
jgi:hypothetical protein